MSEDEYSAAVSDVQDLLRPFSVFHRAMPDENQHIFRHVIKQIREGTNYREEYLRGDRGYETVHTFERSGVLVSKRIFHPGRGEYVTGADLLVSKTKAPGSTGVTMIQVKRNRGKDYFEFLTRDVSQFLTFSQSCTSAYYLMVDETIVPPADCFLHVREMDVLLGHPFGTQSVRTAPIRISNANVRNYCRGTNLFYEAFYSCQRGSTLRKDVVVNNSFTYVLKAGRVLVELLAAKAG